MEAIRLCILGAGSVRCSVPVLASLATYFGERPLDIRLFDSDAERLDLFDRLARVCFIATNSMHHLSFSTNLQESLEGSQIVIVQVGANCARKYLRSTRRQGTAELDDQSMIEQAVEAMVAFIPSNAQVLSLVRPGIDLPRADYYRLDWPGPIEDADRAGIPHQVLRWVRGEEGVFELLKKHENSPLKAWLDAPSTAEQVHTRSGF